MQLDFGQCCIQTPEPVPGPLLPLLQPSEAASVEFWEFHLDTQGKVESSSVGTPGRGFSCASSVH